MYDTDKYYVIAKDLIKTTDFQKTLECWSSLSLIHTGKKVVVLEEGSAKYENLVGGDRYTIESFELKSLEGKFTIRFHAYTKFAFNLIISDGHNVFNRYLPYDEILNFFSNPTESVISMEHLQFKAEIFKGKYLEKEHLLLSICNLESIVVISDRAKVISQLEGIQNYAKV